MAITALILGLSALVISRACISVALEEGLVDHPDERKTHQGAVPLAGGPAFFITLIFGNLALDIPPYTPTLLVIAAGVLLLGLYDDMNHIKATFRLMLQFGAGLLIATWGGISITNVGNLLAMGDIPLMVLAAPLTALAVAGLSNAYNMIDGIDGLAASTVILPLAVLFALAVQAGHPMAPTLLLMIVPLAVFLLYNLGPNNRWLPKMFLGDAGSVTLGVLVTASLVYFSQGEQALINPVTALWLVTVPLMDMLATMLRRLKNGRHLMQADRSHLHHALMDMRFSRRQTLALMLIYGVACAGTGLWLEQFPEFISMAAYFALFGAHCLFVLKSETIGRKLFGNSRAGGGSVPG
ncbi:MAG: MraY family glycosyltransferase [Pseudomonadota bacterium]